MTPDIRTAAEDAMIRANAVEPLVVVDGEEAVMQLTDYGNGFIAGAAWAAARVTPTREQIAEVLRGIGLSDLPDEYDSSIHSWRCEHPEIYGRCSCFDDAVNDLAALMSGLAEGEMIET